MKREDISEIAYRNGYNRAIRDIFKCQRNVQIFLIILVCISIAMSVWTCIRVSELTYEVDTELSQMRAEVNTITSEFRNLAARIDKLEGN